VSEDEAKTKWCPFRRIVRILHDVRKSEHPYEYTATDREQVPKELNCVASGCMAWRWTLGSPNVGNPPSTPMGDGYCGLAVR
jgi:hypothetical protein